MNAFYKKELKSYFQNMSGWIFIAFILLMTGIFFSATNLRGGNANFEYCVYTVSFVFLLVVPIITMRALAEEKHNKTDQLIYSLPVPLHKIVMAKFLSMATVFLFAVAVMMLCPVVLSFFGKVDLLTSYSTLFGFMLLGSSLISIGLFISSLTESQIISAVISFGTFLLIYLMSSLSSLIPTSAIASLIAFSLLALIVGVVTYTLTKSYPVAVISFSVCEIAVIAVYILNKSLFEGGFAGFLKSISLFDRLQSFVLGIFDLSAVIYYLSIIGIFIFFTVQSLDKRRWS
ncbi:MAG: ABC transporter permease [Oscillospiraceae bacterium]|nr:ABC transporter permease [Oscillospiraceae bacterium]